MKTKVSILFVSLAVLFTVSLIVSNIIAGKLWQAPFGIVLTCGVFLFPIVYIIGDVVPECYGLSMARKVIWLGFAMNLYAVIFFFLTMKAAYPPFFEGQSSFEVVLGFTPRLLVASFIAYLIGTNANAWVLVQVKKLTKTKYLWMRTISSTIVGEGLDSLVFVTIAFYGVIPTAALLPMVFYQATFKTLYEVIATPLTYLVIGWVKRQEHIEVVPTAPERFAGVS
jgi:uncharacterized integral membrane protein (TIGR00697 family)